MGCHGEEQDDGPCEHEEALDVICEYVLIAHTNNHILHENGTTSNNIDNNNTGVKNVIQLQTTKYINGPLRKRLQYAKGTLPPPGRLLDLVLKEDGKYHGTTALQHSDQTTIIFFAEGIIKEDGTCYFKLIDTRDEHYLRKQWWDHADFALSVIEKGDEEELEWKHILPNEHTQNFYHFLAGPQFEAKKRHTYEDRVKFHAVFNESKQTRRAVELQLRPTTLAGDKLPPGVFINYLYTDPNTNTDILSIVVFEFEKLIRAKDKIAELTDFFDNAPLSMGVVEMRADDVICMLYGNKQVAKHIGETRNVILRDLFPGMLADYRRMYKKSRETWSIIREEIGYPAIDIYTEVTVSCISYDVEKGVSKHVYILADKTEQKRAEKALEQHKNCLEDTVKARTIELQEKELRFSSLVSNAPNIILSVDRRGIVEFANRHFVSDDASLLIGKYLYTMVVEGQELMQQLRALFETKKSFTFEVKLVEKDIWLTLSAGPMNDNLAIIVATDITEIKQMAEELNHALTTKSRFLANMSHEVRTPLSGIIGMSRMLQETDLTVDQTECVSTIQYCGETLLSVINSILDYTKFESSDSVVTMALERSEISLQQCVEESLYAILPSARQKKLELIVDIDPRAPDRVLGDIIRLRQVMLNLLNNAVKFTDAGFIALSLTASEIEGSDAWKFKFSIHDTGCGVPPESQGKLFQMFSQVDISSTRRYGGTGIGLALAKRFLEMMGGEISLQSSGIPGEGSTFNFAITAIPTPFVPVSPSSHSSPRWLISSTNIFIIEPCKPASEVLRKRLNSKGFLSIKIFNDNPYAAFEEIHKFSTSPGVNNILVLCDIDILNPTKPYPLLGLPNVVTVLMGYLRTQSFDDDEFGQLEFLRKPIKESTLLACLREVWSIFESNTKEKDLLAKRALEGTSHTHAHGHSLVRSNSNSQRVVTKPVMLPCSPKVTPQPVYPLNILVVEDNEINQKVVRRVFQHLGYQISMANNGMEALKSIEQNMPDMILMDVQMPILDGVQTTKIIREKYPNTWVYIVSMTANAFPEDRQNCLDAGMDDFLTKPLRVEQLQTALHKCHRLKLSSKSIVPTLGLRIDV